MTCGSNMHQQATKQDSPSIFIFIRCWREDISLQTKELFVSPTNNSLVGILIAIDDVTDISATFGDKNYKEP